MPCDSLTAPSTLDDMGAMGGEFQTVDRRAVDSMIAWWLEAGVDAPVGEIPRDWLRQNQTASPAAASVANVSEPNSDTLADLRDWLASSLQLPLASASAKRI